MADNFSVNRGIEANISIQPTKSGAMWVSEDKQSLYFDSGQDDKRIEMTSVIDLDKSNVSKYFTNKLYIQGKQVKKYNESTNNLDVLSEVDVLRFDDVAFIYTDDARTSATINITSRPLKGTIILDKNKDAGVVLSSDNTSASVVIIHDNTTITNELTNLKNRLDDIEYEAINIKSFTVEPSQAENGAEVDGITLRWSINKTPKKLTIDGNQIETTLTQLVKTDVKYTSNSTWTIIASDEREKESSKQVTLSFLNRAYIGASQEPLEYNSDFILQITSIPANKPLTNTRTRTVTITAGNNEYIYYAIPISFGTPTFTVNGFSGGFTKVDRINFTNEHGYTTSYDIWKSDNDNLGSTKLVIS